jgi:hypothetical protein
MIVYDSISIPESKQQFFQEFLELIGATYKNKQLNNPVEEIPQWQKNIVLERMKNPKGFVDAFEMLEKLEAKK